MDFTCFLTHLSVLCIVILKLSITLHDDCFNNILICFKVPIDVDKHTY